MKEQTIKGITLEPFTIAYIQTALWSSTDNNGDPLDKGRDLSDCSAEFLKQADTTCRAFLVLADKDIQSAIETGEVVCGPDFDELERAGHDFWLTRNGHGAGFWDGDWPEPYGDRLTKIAKGFPSVDLYIGDDGEIYQG